MTKHRRTLLVILVCGAASAALGFAIFSGSGREPAASDRSATAAPDLVSPANGQLLFRTTALGPAYGRLGLVPLADPAGAARELALTCDRVHFAGGRGICLTADRGAVTTYGASLFDGEFTVRHTLTLEGAPNRTRVSPDGRHGAVTLFARAQSYEGSAVRTRTLFIDMTSGRTIGEAEKFAVSRDGMPFGASALGFRGVTFANDGNRFYATLRMPGALHLVAGDVDAQNARVIADDVECPSLSPDGRRIAFLRHVPEARAVARLHVLTVATGDVIALAEPRSVDDQVEWLDDSRVAYALPHGSGSAAIWAVPADGSGEPVMVRADAFSPAVVR